MTVTINGTTGISTPLGSAAAPSESNTTSSNTGLYFPTSTTLGLSTAGANAVYIDASQNVGIGTISPSYLLDVAGTGVVRISPTTGTNQATLLASNTGGNFYFSKNNSAGTQYATDAYASVLWSSGAYPIVMATNGAERMRIDSSGNLLVGYTSSNGSYKLQVNSQIFATSSTIATSDANYKTNVTPLTGALDLVNKLNPVSFNWKQHPVHDFDTQNTTVGFLAQEVQTALSGQAYVNSIVKESEVTLPDETKENFLGIAEGNMIAILTKAIQELKAEFDAYKATHP